MAFSLDEKDTVIELGATDVSKSLESPYTTLEKINGDLVNIIQSMKKNKSLLSQMAAFWGTKSWWLKILIACSIILPIIITGILLIVFFQIYAVLAIGILVTMLYMGGSLLLDDHQNSDQKAMEELEAGLLALASLLTNIINDLHKVGQELAQEVKQFSEENKILQGSILALNGENALLKDKINTFDLLNKSLKQTNDAIKLSEQNLADLLEKQQKLTVAGEQHRQKMQEEYSQTLDDLKQQIANLKGINQGLSSDLEKMQSQCEILVNTNKELLQLNEESRVNAFYDQLTNALENKGQGAHRAIDTLQDASNTMKTTAQAFKQTLDESTQLMKDSEALRTQGLFKKTAGLSSEAMNKNTSLHQ